MPKETFIGDGKAEVAVKDHDVFDTLRRFISAKEIAFGAIRPEIEIQNSVGVRAKIDLGGMSYNVKINDKF